MESRQTGIFRLCVIMVFFCVSIFFLNNNKKKFITATYIDILNFKVDSLENLSLECAYESLNSLLNSHDIEVIVKVMSQLTYSFAYDLIEKIVQDEASCLSREEKLKIVYGMVAHYGMKKNVHHELLDFLLKYPMLHAQMPALLVLAKSKYADSIALLIAWGKERQKNGLYHNLLSSYAEKAFTVAVENDDCAAVEVLLSKKVRIEQAKASALLWYIVEHNKQSRLVSLLVHHAQANVNYVHKGKTLLIAAVEKNNMDIIRVLLDEGAVVDRTIEGENGTALQIAIMNNYYSAEQLLREYGA